MEKIKKLKKGGELLLQLLVTFIGVYLSLLVTRYETNRQEKEQALTFYSGIVEDFKQVHFLTRKIQMDEVTRALASKKGIELTENQFKGDGSVAYPVLFDTFFENYPTLKYCSNTTVSYLTYLRHKLKTAKGKTFARADYNEARSTEQILTDFMNYNTFISMGNCILTKEIEFQNGQIDKEELKLELKDLKKKANTLIERYTDSFDGEIFNLSMDSIVQYRITFNPLTMEVTANESMRSWNEYKKIKGLN